MRAPHLHICHLLKVIFEDHTHIPSRHCWTQCKALCLAGRRETQEGKERINLLTGHRFWGGGRVGKTRHVAEIFQRPSAPGRYAQICAVPCASVEGRSSLPSGSPISSPPTQARARWEEQCPRVCAPHGAERPLWPLLSREGGHPPRGGSGRLADHTPPAQRAASPCSSLSTGDDSQCKVGAALPNP